MDGGEEVRQEITVLQGRRNFIKDDLPVAFVGLVHDRCINDGGEHEGKASRKEFGDGHC